MRVSFIDCVGLKCKNLQKLLSIEIFYDITINNEFTISYTFYKNDFNIWLEIYKTHIEDIEDYTLYNERGIVLTPINNLELYNFKLVSKDFNLYRNISLIPFIEDKKFINMNKSVYENTCYGEIICYEKN